MCLMLKAHHCDLHTMNTNSVFGSRMFGDMFIIYIILAENISMKLSFSHLIKYWLCLGGFIMIVMIIFASLCFCLFVCEWMDGELYLYGW